jgi:galactosylceramidase
MNAKRTTILAFVLTLSVAQAEEPRVIHLDATSPGRPFEGVGAVSAGASTRLLLDYPEPQRSQVLDFLFKPKFGAAFQHLKVEIGGGENSTCGSEPSHAITREEITDPQPRGYEFWLMAEARKRNPEIILEGLPWAFPGWLEGRFTQDSADWFVAFLEAARKHHNLEIDWIAAAQNELGTDLEWIRKHLRPTLDARGFKHVKLQGPDDDEDFWKIFDILEKDPELDRLIDAVGYHYLDGRRPWKIDQISERDTTEKAKSSGKPLWASEEWSQSGREWHGTGALYLARLINKLYTRNRTTNYLIWSPIDSIYDQILWADTGVMQADSPWSGHYDVWPAVWAVAHTTQFADRGWIYMDNACGQLDPDTWRGSHVALRHPDTGDWSAIVISGDPRRIRILLGENLKSGPVYVWRSNANKQFEQLPSLTPVDGAIEFDLVADAIHSFTTTTGQQKGSHGAPPERKPFPLPFAADFEDQKPGDTPRYLSDQKGTFEVVERSGGGNCIAQIVPQEGILWDHAGKLPLPHTLFGDTEWSDVAIEADVLITGGHAAIGARFADRRKLGWHLTLNHDGRWHLHWQDEERATGTLASFDATQWHRLRLETQGSNIRAFIGGTMVAEATTESSTKGMAYLASSYDRNLFDKIRVLPLPATVP